MTGRLIYLMGPSGSGKDSLLQAAREPLALRGCRIVRRVITRSAEAVGEDAQAVTPAQFDTLERASAFAMSRRANGLCYGIPVQIDEWLAQGYDVLVNGSRSAPMLGLVATMIPMGPALLALTRNDAQGIGENLVVAFSAVILALVAASITFFILTVRRRWLLQELRAVERAREAG
ncbi:hypothetical protein K3Z86_16210 [Pseudomonas aeruginosa]|nr:hypothetical protein [Pseudomonas aeruginosa]